MFRNNERRRKMKVTALWCTAGLVLGWAMPMGAQDLTTQLSLFLSGLRSGYVKTPPVLFASLPACATAIQGAQAFVTDGSSVTWGATQTGGGSSPTGVTCNGTNWTVVSK